ncbi:MAG: hypothetical protein FJZ01_01100 [Candidatus Sericytochromatia bacterium]|nr:hypothetical protein [Candidatus Tanganyikabacteria bacterium]
MLCPDCRKSLRETAPGIGYYCVFCHLAVTVSEAGGYALVLADDARQRRRARRVPLSVLGVPESAV